jgi:hypothetical protein
VGGNGTLQGSPTNIWTAGNGGAGTASAINGTNTGRAGGGGGAANNGQTQGTPVLGTGSSGGGSASISAGTKNGTANTGGGSGGNMGPVAPYPAYQGTYPAGTVVGTGGSGIVIIAYPDSNPALTSIGAGLSYSQPSRSGYRVYQFTGGTGTVTV